MFGIDWVQVQHGYVRSTVTPGEYADGIVENDLRRLGIRRYIEDGENLRLIAGINGYLRPAVEFQAASCVVENWRLAASFSFWGARQICL